MASTDNWDTYAGLIEDGQPFWLVRTTEKLLRAVRSLGLPSEATTGRIAVNIPTLARQAEVQRGVEVPRAEDAACPGIVKFV